MAEFIFVIYTCQKNLEIANKMYNLYFSNTELLNYLKMKVLIMYGDTTISHQFLVKDDKYLVLHCEDDYESLCYKSLRLFKAINYLYPNALGCFKCDDDIMINIESIIININFFKTNNTDYSGTGMMLKDDKNNNLHINKKNIQISKNIHTPSVIFCTGPLYYLSKKAISIVKRIKKDQMAFFLFFII